MGVTIAALIVLSLLQCIAAEPRPEFALSAPVRGTSRVGLAASEANAAISVVNNATLSFTIRYNLTLLNQVFSAVQTVANDFQPLGTTVISSINALASNSSGDVDTVFGAALAAVANASSYVTDRMPNITTPLIVLIGKPLIEKFEDSFQHIGKALSALNVTLIGLQQGARNAQAAVGVNGTLTSAVVASYMRSSLITDLVKGLHLLRATVPVLKYTVDSTIEGIAIADQYMLDLANKVALTLGEKSSIAADLDGIIQAIGSAITNTTTSIGTDLSSLQGNFSSLTNVAAAANGSAILALLGDYAANLADLRNKTPSVDTVLGSLKDSVINVYAVAAPLFIIQDSYVVNALIVTLIANAEYSQYCFYKYKDFFFSMLDTVSIDARECVDKEVTRLEYFRTTIELMLDVLFYDYEDIAGDLTVCNGISDQANLDECITSLAGIYKRLEAAFGDMFALGYDTIAREIAASGSRLKICLRLSQSSLGESDLPLLLEKITTCAQEGPNGNEE